MMPTKCLALCFVLFSLGVSSHAADQFVLTDDSCKMLGSSFVEYRELEVRPGSLLKTICKRDDEGFICDSVGLDIATTFKGKSVTSSKLDIVAENNNLIFLQSITDKYYVNLKTGRFITITTIPTEEGAVIAKMCTGVAK